jgi:hypothetical protein
MKPCDGLEPSTPSAVRFLASPDASYVAGCDLRVDGGTVAAIQQQNDRNAVQAWHAAGQG